MDIAKTDGLISAQRAGKFEKGKTLKKESVKVPLKEDSVSIGANITSADKTYPAEKKEVPVEEIQKPPAEPAEKPSASRSESSPRSIAVIDEPDAAGETQAAEEQTPEMDDSSLIPGPKAKLVDVKSTVDNLTKLARSVKMEENVLLVGPTGAGKTALVKYLAYLTRTPLRRINLNDMTDITEIIGGYKPNKQGRPQWQDGMVVQAMKRGQWLLLDEINLAEPAILERMNSLLDDDRYLVLTEKNNEIVKAHPNFRVFCTMNPASYAGRKKLSKAMMNRLKKIWVDGLEPQEMVEVTKAIFDTGMDDKLLLQMAMFHQTIADMAQHRQIGKRDGPYPFTLRDMLKWVKRIDYFHKKNPSKPLGKIIWQEARHVYGDRFIKDADKAVVEDTLKITFGEDKKPDDVKKEITSTDRSVKIASVELEKNPEGGQFVPSEKANLVHVSSTVDMLEKMGKCVKFDEPVLLVGPTAAGKTAKVKYLARLTNNNLRRYNLSMQTDTTEFIGGYKPTGVPGEYKWVDGILVDAMKKGDWVVLDEINLAEPAILERINSLLDGDRSLVLSEKEGERVEAHPNFRIFATMNPATSEYGGRKELSLAMRNRFTEIWDPGLVNNDELTEIVKVFLKKVEGGEKIAPKMVEFQAALQEKVEDRELAKRQREGFVYTIRNLASWCKFIKTFAPDDGLEKAFVNGADHIYASEFAEKDDRKYVVEMAKKFYSQQQESTDKPQEQQET